MPRPDVFALLMDTFRCLEREAPEADGALKAAVGPLRARLSTEGRAHVVAVQACAWTLRDAEEPADIDIGFDRSVVLDLIEARTTLEDAAMAGRLHVLGDVATVERLHGALAIYLEGLMRARGAAKLYRRFCEA